MNGLSTSHTQEFHHQHKIYISIHCILFMTYILVQKHATSTTRGELQKFATLDTSGCLMADVQHLDHLRDDQKEHHNTQKVIWSIGSSIACIACFYKPYDCLATLGSPIGALFHSPMKNLTRRPTQFKSYADGT